MKKYLIILILSFTALLRAAGQGLVEPPLPLPDTSGWEENGPLLPENNLLLNNPAIGGLVLPLLLQEEIKLPKFDFNQNLFSGMKPDYTVYNGSAYSPGVFGGSFFAANPFARDAFVFNQAAYKISDRLSFGGNSFGVNSIFSAPLPNRGPNSYDFRGASMFMQYKISKNITVETRVSVANGGM